MQLSPNGIISQWHGYNFLVNFMLDNGVGLNEVGTFVQPVGNSATEWIQVGANGGAVYQSSSMDNVSSFPQDSLDHHAFMATIVAKINNNFSAWIAANVTPTPTPLPSFPTAFADFVTYAKAGGIYATTTGPNKINYWAEINSPKGIA